MDCEHTTLCPECAQPFCAEQTVWFAKGAFYCSEQCCNTGYHRYRPGEGA